jgi:predicted ATPase
MRKRIPFQVYEAAGESERGRVEAGTYSDDPEMLLNNLAFKYSVPTVGPPRDDPYERLKAQYATVCAPHRIHGLEHDDVGTHVVFSDGASQYPYEGLSSGEQMVLLFLIGFATERLHRSVILIDELELHQHPLWQRQLYNLLPAMGHDNQFIITTHSDYLRDVVPHADTKVLGDLA